MSAIVRALRLLRWRPGLLLLGAVLLAVGAEASSVALLSVSGWFVVACFVLAGDPGFNYLGPSGAVRALALARIVLRYLQRLVAHTATLRWLTRLRVRLFDDVAALPREQAGRLRTGDLLDRLLRDVETLDELVLRCLVPLASVTAVAGSAVLVLTGVSPAAAAIAAGGWLLAMTASGCGPPPTRRPRAAPPAASSWRPVGPGASWPRSAPHRPCVARAARLADLTAVEEQVERRAARAGLVTDLGVGLTVLGATWVTAAGDAAITTVAMVALLTTAVGDLLSALGPAMAYARRAVVAARRLELGDEPVAGAPASLPAAASPVQVSPGAEPVVLTGPSGAGKTTLLRRLRSEHAAGASGGRVVLVPHDDQVLTGTVADNLRLADPDLDDDAMRHLLDLVRLDRAGIAPETPTGTGGRELSGGEQRRLTLARAIAARPDLLLLDEPVTGVDPPTAQAVLAAVRTELPATALVLTVHESQRDAVPFDAAWVRLDSPALAGTPPE